MTFTSELVSKKKITQEQLEQDRVLLAQGVRSRGVLDPPGVEVHDDVAHAEAPQAGGRLSGRRVGRVDGVILLVGFLGYLTYLIIARA